MRQTQKREHPLKKWVKLLCLFLLLLPTLSGCWDRLEIEERANVLGMAIDAEPQQDEKQESETSHLRGRFPLPNKSLLRLTAQIAVPGRIPLGPGGGGGGGGGGGEGGKKSVWVVSVVGHTVDDAMMNLQQQLADQIYLSHLRVIIVGEKLAKKDIASINEYLRRNSEVRRAAWLMVSKGKASEVMKASPELERVPALYLMSTLDHAVGLGKFPNDFLGAFWIANSSKGQDPFLPYIEIRSNNNVHISGMAFFRNNKMVGVTKPLEIGVYMAVKGLNPGGYSVAVHAPGHQGNVMVRVFHRKARIKMDLQNGKPHARIKVAYEWLLEEKSNNRFKIDNTQVLHQIENNVSVGAKKSILELIQKTEAEQSDIFGFGELVRATMPKYWDTQIQNHAKWETVYQTMPVDVEVTSKIRRVGMMAQ